MKGKSTFIPWKRLDIPKRIDELLQIISETRQSTPVENTRTLDKLERWRDRLLVIKSAILKIESEYRKELESIIGVRLGDGELLAISLIQPSTKNLFLELETHYCRNKSPRIDCKRISDLAMLSEFAKSLALVGDAALSLAILHYLWRPSIMEVGHLTQRRADLVSNNNLADLCDLWNLYEHRIHFDPPAKHKSEIEHDKGTLVEAVYGIIYILHGFEKLQEAAKHLFDVVKKNSSRG